MKKIKDLGILNPEEFSEEEKQKLLGKEMVFSGVIRMNKFFNNNELTIDSAEEVNVDDLVLKLENN